MGATLADDKRAVRLAALTARRSLSRAQRQTASAAICRQVIELPELAGVGTALLYAAADDEVDVADVADALRARGVDLLYPRVAGRDLEVARVLDRQDLRPGYRGLSEPTGPARDPGDIEVVITPGVAFDDVGGRLGWGQGFYDRFFITIDRAVWRIGVGFSCQVIAQVPRELHDEPLDVLVTERAVVRPDPGPGPAPHAPA